jgi:hypothetical protein
MFKNNFVFDAISDAISKVIAEKIDPSVKTTDALQGPVPGGNDNGIRKPKVKLAAEEVEELDELSKGTLKSYAKKASSSTDERSASNLASRAAAKLAVDDPDDDGEKDDRKSFHRSRGISRAIDKLTKEETHDEGHPDEVEDKELVRSMVKKAALKSKEVAEATDTETKDASGKVTGWQHTGDWKKSTGSSIEKGKGKVAHLSDLARKKTVKLAAEEVELDEAEELEELVRVKPQGNMISKHFNGYDTEGQRRNTARSVKLARSQNRANGGPTRGAKSGEYDGAGSRTVTTYNNPLTKAFARKGPQGKSVKEESLDEISKSTLGSYVKKATKDARIHGMIATDFEHRAKASRKPSYKETAKNISDKYKSRAWKREAGIGKAVDKLTKEENEE